MHRSCIPTFLLISILALFSCDKSTLGPDLVTMQVADRYKDCVGLYPRKCLQVKENNAPNWHLFYDPIQGFAYEEGYEYVLLVKREPVENPPADASSVSYALVELISKQKK